MIDAIACEAHFLDHMAPIWTSLPSWGRFLVDAPLLERARAKGIDAEVIDAQAIREAFGQQPPRLDGPEALVASIGDIKVARRLGYGPFAFLEHGAGQWYGGGDGVHSSYSGGPDHDDVGLFLVPSETVAQRWRNRYPNARASVVGCPKIDTLPAKQPDLFLTRPVVCVSFHWPAPLSVGNGLAGTAWIEYRNALPVLAERFAVIGHQHPNWLQPRSGIPPSMTYAQLGIPFVPDFEEVCRVADLYVCDNSSTIWEFAATGRPVVLLNTPGWAKSRGKIQYGLRFWDAADVGINVDRAADLVAGVERALEDEPTQQIAREAAVNRVYGLRTNGATVAATAITDWLASRQAVAA